MSTSTTSVATPFWAVGSACALTLPGLLLRTIGIAVPPIWQSAIAGISLVAAAFLLAWAAEAAQTVIAGGLAIAFLALITVLPEYAVDILFSWKAAHDPAQAHFAIANMTGANRLLIGIGWSGIVLLAAMWAWRRRQPAQARMGVALPAQSVIELVLLLAATAYALLLSWRGRLTLLDTGILFTLFGCYLWFLARSGAKESADNLLGPARALALMPSRRRTGALIGLFALAAVTIAAVAEPFAEGLVAIGHQMHLDTFVLVQIVAPLASEAPEFVVIALFVFAGRAQIGLQALVSSKVNQWTLLVGSIPLVYTLAGGGIQGFTLDTRQSEEILLTAAQGLLAVVLVLDRRLGITDSLILLSLYVAQLVVSTPDARVLFAFGYLALTVLAFAGSHEVRQGVLTMPARFHNQLRCALMRKER